MKKIKKLNIELLQTIISIIVTIAIICLVAVLFFYFNTFKSGLSINQDVWGQFGDYVGGVMNPLFGFLGLIALLLTIIVQTRQLEISQEELKTSNEELKLTREELTKSAAAAEKQVLYYKNQMKREDLYRLITTLTDRINLNFNSEEIITHKTLGYSMNRIFIDGDNVNDNPIMKRLYDHGLNKNTKAYKIIRFIEDDLFRLSELIKEYELATEGEVESTPLSSFYKVEFGYMVKTLHEYSLIDSKLHNLYVKGYFTDL